MSDKFMARGGDCEALLLILLLPRLAWKADILISQIREKFAPSHEKIDKETLCAKGEKVHYWYLSPEICCLFETLAFQFPHEQQILALVNEL